MTPPSDDDLDGELIHLEWDWWETEQDEDG
jgi:hypothetical protein